MGMAEKSQSRREKSCVGLKPSEAVKRGTSKEPTD